MEKKGEKKEKHRDQGCEMKGMALESLREGETETVEVEGASQ